MLSIRRAVEIDPNFATAYCNLDICYLVRTNKALCAGREGVLKPTKGDFHAWRRFPHLSRIDHERLQAQNAGDAVLAFWRELVAEEILPEEEDDKFFD